MKYGRFTIIGAVTGGGNRRVRVVCSCPARTERVVELAALKSGHTRSCGCLRRELVAARSRIHGKTGTPEFRAWANMLQRCENPNWPRYADYGGRGIKIHQAWRTNFETFLADVGARPSRNHSLDRIDNNGNYEPGNVRWATRSQQQRNKRRFSRPRTTTSSAPRSRSMAR